MGKSRQAHKKVTDRVRANAKKSESKPAAAPKKKATVTGKGGRNVGGKANVTKEQLAASGLSLGAYLNQYDKTGKRPGAKKSGPAEGPKTRPAKSKTTKGPADGPSKRPAKSKSTAGPASGPTSRGGKRTPKPKASLKDAPKNVAPSSLKPQSALDKAEKSSRERREAASAPRKVTSSRKATRSKAKATAAAKARVEANRPKKSLFSKPNTRGKS